MNSQFLMLMAGMVATFLSLTLWFMSRKDEDAINVSQDTMLAMASMACTAFAMLMFAMSAALFAVALSGK